MAFLQRENLPDNNTTASAPFLAAALTCAAVLAFPALTRLSAWLRGSAPRALIVLLTANAIDAIATAYGLGHGAEAEANPVIRTIGLPAKLVLVSAGAVIIWRVKPRMLWIPAYVLLGVLLWHLAGIALNN